MVLSTFAPVVIVCSISVNGLTVVELISTNVLSTVLQAK